MRQRVIEHLKATVASYRDLIAAMPESALGDKLSDRSNTLGAQMWCVVGARESYADAIDGDGWAGFSCSLTGSDIVSKERVLAALDGSAARLGDVVNRVAWTETRDEMLLALLEHESQHQGQIIRYGYALGHRFPDSWVARWALDQPG